MSERLTLQDLVDLLSDKQNITKKDAETFLRELVALISETIEQKDFVRIKDFGTFKLTPVNARRSVDVNTGDPIEIPAHYKLSFTPDKVLREGVNRPFSHFESILLEDEVSFEDKKAAPVEAKPVVKSAPKKAEAKPAETIKTTPTTPKKEIPAVEEIVAVTELEEEKPITSNKVEEVLENTPEAKSVEKEVLAADDLQREEELEDINSFLTKGLEEKQEVKPASASGSSVHKEVTPPTTRKAVRQYDDDDDDFVDYEYIAQQKKKRNIWIGVGVGILLLLGVGIFGYNYLENQPDVIPYAQDNAKITISEEDKPLVVEEPVVADNTLASTEDESEIEEAAPTVEQPVVTPPVSAVPEQGAKEIEVKSGQTMRVLGMEYFGHGSFWVYIFEENRDKISRPDAVFAGMKLIIPSASKYDIDPNDKASVRKAQRQELKLFGEFSDK